MICSTGWSRMMSQKMNWWGCEVLPGETKNGNKLCKRANGRESV